MRLEDTDLDGPVAYADFGGEGPSIVCVHGLGGNHANWMPAGPLLARHGRVLAPDLPGFGRTPPRGRSSALPANRAIIDRFIREVAGGPAIVVGNSMGGLLTIMQAAESPDTVAGAILVCPAIPRPPGTLGDPMVVGVFAVYATPFAGEALMRRRMRRLGPEGLVRETLRMCTVDVGRVPEEAVQEAIEIARWRMAQSWPTAAYLEAARSLIRILSRRARFYEMARRIKVPVLMVHGARDRLVPLAAARALSEKLPDWTLQVMEDVGHVPMLEMPEQFAAHVDTWLTGPGAPALTEATSGN